MSTENKSIHEFEFQLICEFFNLIERQGPGSTDVTQKALSFLYDLPENPKIADLGCGSGGQTITLAQNTNGHITAIDLFPDFINSLQRKTKELGLNNKITAEIGSMDDLPFLENEFDAIWAEGSIYNIGYRNGLRQWRKYLKNKGYIAVSEVSWFTKTRPDEIEQFWLDAYPEIDTISNKVNQMQEAGYTPVAHFILPENCWEENFYIPMNSAMDIFLEKYKGNKTAKEFVESEKKEMSLYRKYKKYYGYVFYIGQKIESNNESNL